jgi:hypothetical protein
MAMRPSVRKAALTTHVVSSVGWLGAVAASLALAIAGLTNEDDQTVRAVYLTMELTGWSLLVPLALASLLTGLVQALGTSWGLFRHYWVVVKLLMNLFALVVLLLYLQTLSELADLAADTSGSRDLDMLRSASPVLHSGAALVLLVIATTLSIYKPRGLTPYGQRKREQHRAPQT